VLIKLQRVVKSVDLFMMSNNNSFGSFWRRSGPAPRDEPAVDEEAAIVSGIGTSVA